MEKQFWQDYRSSFFAVPVVVVSVDGKTRPNLITLGWTGIVNSDPLMVGISVRPSRYSRDLLHEHKVFGLNIPNKALAAGTDYCGIKSGRDVDKVSELGWHVFRGRSLGVPLVEEFPVNAECQITQIIPLGSHELFLAEVKGVYIAKEYLKGNRVDWTTAEGLVYGSQTYYVVKEGVFGQGDSYRELKK
ncbi:MAG TPA: flavin reductase family protein [Bacillota bacterium]|nr:flavin reductase family protein [Bacillota bacterium]HPQ10111.1 flavin reductase family protein [Bacillota bacterium]